MEKLQFWVRNVTGINLENHATLLLSIITVFLQFTITSVLKSNNGWILFYLKKTKRNIFQYLWEKRTWISEICIQDSIPNWNENSYFQMANQILELTSHYLDKAINSHKTPRSRQIWGSFKAFQIIEIVELPVTYFALFWKLYHTKIHKCTMTQTHTNK